jgi:hypothetical protein
MRKPGHRVGAALTALLTLAVLAGCRSRVDGAAVSAGSPQGPSSSSSSSSSSASTGVGGSSSGAPSRARPVTRVVHFRPFSDTGSAATAARAAGSGQCFSTSITVPTAHTYRCFGDKEIFDPCFASPVRADPGSVFCYLDPWSPARRLTVTARLPDATPLPHPRPWALQLANGARCISVTGTVPVDHGIALTYFCSNGHAAGLDAGHGQLRTASYGRPPDGALTRVAVTTMWTA